MDSSSHDEYGNKDHDEFIYKEFVGFSALDDEYVEMTMMMSIQEELEKQEEHVSNFKVSIKRAGELFTWIESLA